MSPGAAGRRVLPTPPAPLPTPSAPSRSPDPSCSPCQASPDATSTLALGMQLGDICKVGARCPRRGRCAFVISALLIGRLVLMPAPGGPPAAPACPCPGGDVTAAVFGGSSVTRRLSPPVPDAVRGHPAVPLRRRCPPGACHPPLLPRPRPGAALPAPAQTAAPPALPAGGHPGLAGAGTQGRGDPLAPLPRGSAHPTPTASLSPQLPALCLSLCQLSRHHHNLVALLKLLPDLTSRDRYVPAGRGAGQSWRRGDTRATRPSVMGSPAGAGTAPWRRARAGQDGMSLPLIPLFQPVAQAQSGRDPAAGTAAPRHRDLEGAGATPVLRGRPSSAPGDGGDGHGRVPGHAPDPPSRSSPSFQGASPAPEPPRHGLAAEAATGHPATRRGARGGGCSEVGSGTHRGLRHGVRAP